MSDTIFDMKKVVVMVLLALLIVGIYLCSNVRTSPEKRFWAWFERNQDFYYSYSSNDYTEENRQKIVELQDQIKKVNPNLSFELLPIEDDGRRGFAITANHKHTHELLILVSFMPHRAPRLDKWHIYAFRQRKENVDVVNQTTGIRMGTDTVFFTYKPKNWLSVTLYIDGYTPSETNTYLYEYLLDNVVGESNTISTVLVDGVYSLKDAPNKTELLPIMQLRAILDEGGPCGPNSHCKE